MSGQRAFGCHVIVPLKSLDSAKERLALPVPTRRALMVAFARDVVKACDGLPVLLVADREWQELLPDTPVVADPGQGLNAAVRRGLAVFSGRPVLVVMGDLPCLTPDAVGQAVDQLQHTSFFVPDRDGYGTTVLAGTADDLRPAFGPESAAAHRQLGYEEWADTPGQLLRYDVDCVDDLTAAVAAGVGLHTHSQWVADETTRWDRPEGRSHRNCQLD